MAHKKGEGSTQNGRDSISKRLGVKLYGGQTAKAGNIIIRQRGTQFHPGQNTYLGKDFTLHASILGKISFTKGKGGKTFVHVLPFEAPVEETVAKIEKVAKKPVTVEATPVAVAETKAPKAKTAKPKAETAEVVAKAPQIEAPAEEIVDTEKFTPSVSTDDIEMDFDSAFEEPSTEGQQQIDEMNQDIHELNGGGEVGTFNITTKSQLEAPEGSDTGDDENN